MKTEIVKMIALLATEYPTMPAFSEDRLEMWVEQLQVFPAGSVLKAGKNHMRTNRWPPQLADLVQACQAQAGGTWLTADEAWAQVPKQENKPGLLNDVTSQALAAALPLLESGDDVAARMAFKGAYTRLVEQAKINGRQPKHWLSPGGTQQEIEAVQAEGVRQGLLPAPTQVPAPLQLAAPKRTPGAKPDLKALLLGMQTKAMPQPDPEDYRAAQ